MARHSGMAPTSQARDQRLDLVRGIMLLVIFVAHVPNNLWADYIPARFGFSSGAEIFVFVSGIASGLAFGRAFVRSGFAEGARRVGRRMLQLYGAHLGTLLVLGGFALLVDAVGRGDAMARRYGLEWLRDHPGAAMLDFATLRYVPPFFDILPMYVVLLALVVPAMAIGPVSSSAVLGLSALGWLVMQHGALHLTGDPVAGSEWYFNPFAWQFLFLLGYSFGIGWLKAPPRGHRLLTVASAAILLLSVPLTFWGFAGVWPPLDALHRAIYPADAITVLAPARLVHFLALAYLAWSLVDPAAGWLQSPRLATIARIGRNSFGCFLAGLALSMLGGLAIDLLGPGWMAAHLVNLAGIGALVVVGWMLDRRRDRPLRHAPIRLSVAEQRREPASVA